MVMVLNLMHVQLFYWRIIFGVSNSVSVHVTIKKKDILILKKGPTDGLGDAKLTTNIEYFNNFTEQQRNFA